MFYNKQSRSQHIKQIQNSCASEKSLGIQNDSISVLNAIISTHELLWHLSKQASKQIREKKKKMKNSESTGKKQHGK